MSSQSHSSARISPLLCIIIILSLLTSSFGMIVKDKTVSFASSQRFSSFFQFYFDKGGSLDLTLTLKDSISQPITIMFCSASDVTRIETAQLTFAQVCQALPLGYCEYEVQIVPEGYTPPTPTPTPTPTPSEIIDSMNSDSPLNLHTLSTDQPTTQPDQSTPTTTTTTDTIESILAANQAVLLAEPSSTPTPQTPQIELETNDEFIAYTTNAQYKSSLTEKVYKIKHIRRKRVKSGPNPAHQAGGDGDDSFMFHPMESRLNDDVEESNQFGDKSDNNKFQQWISDLHPSLAQVSSLFNYHYNNIKVYTQSTIQSTLTTLNAFVLSTTPLTTLPSRSARPNNTHIYDEEGGNNNSGQTSNFQTASNQTNLNNGLDNINSFPIEANGTDLFLPHLSPLSEPHPFLSLLPSSSPTYNDFKQQSLPTLLSLLNPLYHQFVSNKSQSKYLVQKAETMKALLNPLQDTPTITPDIHLVYKDNIATRSTYYLLQLNCDGIDYSMKMSSSAVNPGGEYLSLSDVPYKRLYYAFIYIILAALSIWTLHYGWSFFSYGFPVKYHVYLPISTILIFQLLHCFFADYFWNLSSTTGTLHIQYEIAAEVFNLLAFASYICFFTSLSIGFGVIRDYIHWITLKRMLFMTLYVTISKLAYDFGLGLGVLLFMLNLTFIWMIYLDGLKLSVTLLQLEIEQLVAMDVKLVDLPILQKLKMLVQIQGISHVFILGSILLMIYHNAMGSILGYITAAGNLSLLIITLGRFGFALRLRADSNEALHVLSLLYSQGTISAEVNEKIINAVRGLGINGLLLSGSTYANRDNTRNQPSGLINSHSDAALLRYHSMLRASSDLGSIQNSNDVELNVGEDLREDQNVNVDDGESNASTRWIGPAVATKIVKPRTLRFNSFSFQLLLSLLSKSGKHSKNNTVVFTPCQCFLNGSDKMDKTMFTQFVNKSGKFGLCPHVYLGLRWLTGVNQGKGAGGNIHHTSMTTSSAFSNSNLFLPNQPTIGDYQSSPQFQNNQSAMPTINNSHQQGQFVTNLSFSQLDFSSIVSAPDESSIPTSNQSIRPQSNQALSTSHFSSLNSSDALTGCVILTSTSRIKKTQLQNADPKLSSRVVETTATVVFSGMCSTAPQDTVLISTPHHHQPTPQPTPYSTKPSPPPNSSLQPITPAPTSVMKTQNGLYHPYQDQE